MMKYKVENKGSHLNPLLAVVKIIISKNVSTIEQLK